MLTESLIHAESLRFRNGSSTDSCAGFSHQPALPNCFVHGAATLALLATPPLSANQQIPDEKDSDGKNVRRQNRQRTDATQERADARQNQRARFRCQAARTPHDRSDRSEATRCEPAVVDHELKGMEQRVRAVYAVIAAETIERRARINIYGALVGKCVSKGVL